MNREILFRGKDYKGNWVFGHYAYFVNYPDSIKKHWILDGETEDGKRGDFEIDPDTLGQYTGLTDKNGAKIFEGDIVDISSFKPSRYEVLFNRGGFCMRHSKEDAYYPDGKYLEDGEIIGNIHGNPQMINQ